MSDRSALCLLEGLLVAQQGGQAKECPYQLSAGPELHRDDLLAASWLVGFLWQARSGRLDRHENLGELSEAWQAYVEPGWDEEHTAAGLRLKVALVWAVERFCR